MSSKKIKSTKYQVGDIVRVLEPSKYNGKWGKVLKVMNTKCTIQFPAIEAEGVPESLGEAPYRLIKLVERARPRVTTHAKDDDDVEIVP